MLRQRLALAEYSGATDGATHLPADRLRPSAVLIPLLARQSGMNMLLTRRSDHLREHAGQVSFPGGRMEATDRSPEETALREAHEEIGLSPHHVQLLGRLMPYHTTSGYLIHPWIGLIEDPPTFRPSPVEVAEIFEVPLAFLLEPGNYRRETVTGGGQARHVHAIPYRGYRIWGATAAIIHQFHRLVRGE